MFQNSVYTRKRTLLQNMSIVDRQTANIKMLIKSIGYL